MVKYIIRRLGYVVVVFFIISIVMFFVYKLVPGDPVLMMLDSTVAQTDPVRYQEMYQTMRDRLGLDKPLWTQYAYWIGNMLKGDFGYSAQHRIPVKMLVAEPMVNTIILNLLSLILVFGITIPLGIITAVKHRSLLDNAVQVGTVVGISLPSFLLSLLGIFFFAVKIRVFPIGGMVTAGLTGTPFQLLLDRLRHMALPLIVMTVSSMAGITRYVRTAMIDALRQDYIRTARAKGLREKVVIYSHAFRNALIPVVTIMTMWFVGIFGGSVVVESVFSYNGIGHVLFAALKQLDFSVVLAMNMFYAMLTLIGNLLMDLMYGLVDPRVKLN